MGKNGKNGKPLVELSLLDKAICRVSPKIGANRIRSKALLSIYQNSGITAGKSGKLSLRGWLTDNADADNALIPQLDVLRSRSRDAFENIPIATGALKRPKTNVIGSGLQLQSRIKRVILELSDEDADKWERFTELRFNMWAESKECDSRRTQNFYEQQGLAFLSMLMSGDVFGILPRIPRPDMENDLRIAMYEADFVSNPNFAMDTNKQAGGIELDDNGAPETYWFSTKHPGSLEAIQSTWKRIRAFGQKTGRRNVIHLFNPERPGQRRGKPILSPVLESLKQLGRYTEAELMASVINAFFTVFVKTDTQQGDPLQEGFADSQKISDADTVEKDKGIYEMGSGNIIGLDENEDIKLADPNRPNSEFDKFFIAIVKQIGSAIGIPFEQLLLHFSASYSASRGALVEAWKLYKEYRIFMARNWCQPIYAEWLYEEVLNGRIIAPGFLDNKFKKYAWLGAAWTGPGQGQIDPVKESKGAHQRIEDNLTTYEDEYIAISGGDWQTAMNRKAREEKFLKEKELFRAPKPTGGQGNPDGDRTDPLPEE